MIALVSVLFIGLLALWQVPIPGQLETLAAIAVGAIAGAFTVNKSIAVVAQKLPPPPPVPGDE